MVKIDLFYKKLALLNRLIFLHNYRVKNRCNELKSYHRKTIFSLDVLSLLLDINMAKDSLRVLAKFLTLGSQCSKLLIYELYRIYIGVSIEIINDSLLLRHGRIAPVEYMMQHNMNQEFQELEYKRI